MPRPVSHDARRHPAREFFSAPVASSRLRGVRVLFVLPSLEFGGAERQAFLLARHLVNDLGAAVRLVAFGPIGGLAGMCDKEGIPWSRFELRHQHPDRIGKVRDLFRFTSLLRRHQVQVLLPYCMFQNVLCALTWRLAGARVCIWNQRDEGRQRLASWLERLAVGQTRCFVSNSLHGAEFLTKTLGVRPEQVHAIHNGVQLAARQLDRATWRAKLGLSETAFVGTMVANLHSYKDHATLVTGWRHVVDRLCQPGRQAHLLLAGAPGDRQAPLVKQVNELELVKHVHFLGPVEDVAGLLGATDLAVFSSCTEGVPNAVLEAMCAGLAVVATDYPGIREAVGPAGAPLLVRPQDPYDLADKVMRAAQDNQLCSSLGAQGRIRAAAEFSVNGMCRETVQRILQQWGARA